MHIRPVVFPYPYPQPGNGGIVPPWLNPIPGDLPHIMLPQVPKR